MNPEAIPFKSAMTNSAILHTASHDRTNVLLKTAIAEVLSQSHSSSANILLDEGAQRSFITEDLARVLHLPVSGHDTISLASFGRMSQGVRSIPTSEIYLKSETRDLIKLEVLVVPMIAVPLQKIPTEIRHLDYLRGLKLAHPLTEHNNDLFEISLLVGADYYWDIVEDRVIRGKGPTAVKLKIGYLLSGPLPVSGHRTTDLHMMNVISAPPSTFEMEKFWQLESMGISSEESTDGTSGNLQEYMCNSISFEDGRYVAKLPWRDYHPTLPTNYDICKRRTEATIRRLSQEPEVLKTYGEIIADQLKGGVIEKVDQQEDEHTVNYIPHHGVKKDSVTTPIHIVYDCSCRQSRDHPSLNDSLMSAPPELNDLTGILLRFRMHKYAVATDIEKAFLQIGLHESDRDVTRFLWLSDPSDPCSPLTTYRFRTILFGATCSPFILGATICKHLELNSTEWVTDYLKRDLYVDNVLSSFFNEQDLLQFYSTSRKLMSAAGFNLRAWNSNSEQLRAKASEEKLLDTDTCTKNLGMQWICKEDTLTFAERQIETKGVITKRAILQQISRVFDIIQQTGLSDVYLWSDSQIVLHWLVSKKTLPRFVQNRLTEIQSLTQNRKWRYCPTHENPADLLTRGLSASQLQLSELWFKGPTWLSTPDAWSEWQPTSDMVTVATVTVTNNSQEFIDVKRFSSFQKLIRVTAYVLRFIHYCRNGRKPAGIKLTIQEMTEAETACIRTCQMTSYPEEIQCLKDNKKVSPLVKQLKLFMKDNVIRCGGRIHNAALEEETKHPILLSAKHAFTHLVVKDAHERLHHSGPSSTITLLRGKYWIPAIRPCVRSVLRKCVICKKVSGRPYKAPDPPPLPKTRVSDVAPFTYTGVDYSGALSVRDTYGKDMKTYICLFTCASTRAVHLELVPDLSAESFLFALRRFCSRKSTPKIMMSDNGTTFTAAARHLNNLCESAMVLDEFNNRLIDWKFIPTRAPWFGGWWRRMIGLTKNVLKKVLGKAYVTYETLQTIVTEAEAVINDRPFTYVTSGELGQPETLTPAHLLYGRRITSLPDEPVQIIASIVRRL